MRVNTVLSVLAAALVLTACGRGGGAATPQPMAPYPAPVRIYYDDTGGIADSLRLVVKDAAEFERVWQRATSRQTSPPPPASVDFNRDMVLVVGAGRLTPGDQITVDSVGLTRAMNAAGRMVELLSVVVKTTTACERIAFDAYPLEIVRVRRFDGEVRFVENRVQAQNCRDGPEPIP